jgi:hypothetical protein
MTTLIQPVADMMKSPGGMLFGGSAAFGLIFGFWGQIKTYAAQIYGLFVERLSFHEKLAHPIEFHCEQTMRMSWGSQRYYYPEHVYVRPEKRRRFIGLWFPSTANTRVYWKGWRPVFISSSKDSNVTVSFLRGTFKLEDFLVPGLELMNKTAGNGCRYHVSRCSGTLSMRVREGAENTGGDKRARPEAVQSVSGGDGVQPTWNPIGFDLSDLGEPADNPIGRIAMTPDQMDALQEAKVWLASKEWFQTRGVPWKRGWLLKGPAGTGKTSTARAVAQHLGLPLYLFDIASMTNGDFQEAWDRASGNTPCIVLIEDIDAVFNGRENMVSAKHDVFGMTFDCLLNCVDGAINSDGILLMVTTNHPEKLDAALSGVESDGMTTRPGRIDRSIEFGPLDEQGKRKIAARIFEGFPESAWADLVDQTPASGAQFQERCTRLALRLFWEREEERRKSGQDAVFVERDVPSPDDPSRIDIPAPPGRAVDVYYNVDGTIADGTIWR